MRIFFANPADRTLSQAILPSRSDKMILFPNFAGNWCTAAAHFSLLPSSFLALSSTTEGSSLFRGWVLGLSLSPSSLSLSLSLSRPFSEHQEKGEEQKLGVQCVEIETNIQAFSRTYNGAGTFRNIFLAHAACGTHAPYYICPRLENHTIYKIFILLQPTKFSF